MNSEILSSKNQKKNPSEKLKKKKKRTCTLRCKPIIIQDQLNQVRSPTTKFKKSTKNSINQVIITIKKTKLASDSIKTKQNYQNGGTYKFLTYDFT
jgi:hypothetical protein